MEPIITLTTDFGTTDGYVGAMKGVLLGICPKARLVDITHEIPHRDVRRAAITLWSVASFCPAGTVHLVVVDPTVGTARRPLALYANGMFFVGPDNGVFTLVAAEGTSVVALEETVYHRQTGPISATFHGRDVFAPVAAHLASGVSLEALGTRVDCWVRLPFPPFVSHGANRWSGEVLYLDHFGNGVTNLRVLETHGERMRLVPLGSPAPLPNLQMAANHICWRERELPLVRTYGDVAPGQTLALIGSQGLVEIAVCDGSAGASLGVQPGDPVWFISEC